MFFGGTKRGQRTAAWRVTAGGLLVFAIGSALAFLFLQEFLVRDLQRRADGWLVGELGVLADVAERTPHDRLHDIIVREVAELASREAPHDNDTQPALRTVFFVIADPDGTLVLHTGAGGPATALLSNLRASSGTHELSDLRLAGYDSPFRVARTTLPSGQQLYLGLSSQYERSFLHTLRVRFALIWLIVLGLSSSILFLAIRRMLMRVQALSDAAATIGRNNLTTRVPIADRDDEISRLAITFNQMLDRIESTVQQMNTMSDAIAHDIRSPLTAIRGRLEVMLTYGEGEEDERIPSLIEDVDRLANLLAVSLDISEANANALRMRRSDFDLSALLQTIARLYEPMLNDAGIAVETFAAQSATVYADATLIERVFMNLFENALKHLKPGDTLSISLSVTEDTATITFRDTGTGFPDDLLPVALEPFTRGLNSKGSGLGLAFVAAVIRMHDGSVRISNAPQGGARIVLQFACSHSDAQPTPSLMSPLANVAD